MKKKFLSLSLLTFILLLAAPVLAAAPAFASPPATPDLGTVLKVQLRYMSLLLKIRNVEYVATATCHEGSGALITIDSPPADSSFDCIAVKLKNASDVSAVQTIYGNPLVLDGVLIHFTDQDTVPNKAGITVHN